MRLLYFFLLFLSVMLSTQVYAQYYKELPGHRFSREEVIEMSLDHSKKQKQ